MEYALLYACMLCMMKNRKSNGQLLVMVVVEAVYFRWAVQFNYKDFIVVLYNTSAHFK